MTVRSSMFTAEWIALHITCGEVELTVEELDELEAPDRAYVVALVMLRLYKRRQRIIIRLHQRHFIKLLAARLGDETWDGEVWGA